MTKLREFRGRKPVVDERKVTNIRQMPFEVRLTREDQNNSSTVMPAQHAWNISQETGLDLILITKDAKPPVYRLCDYGKFKFAEEKHAKEMAKANRANARTVKELRINQNIGPADYERNLSRIREWLPHHDVKVEVIMKGFRGHANRLALPRGMAQSDAPKWPDFILNRVLRDLGAEVRSDRISVGLHGISTMVRPA